MNLEFVEKIANAVLYEGYMLYPYRASSVKNQQRFNWGALTPKTYSVAQNGTEIFEMQTECLVRGDEKATLEIKIRFLHLTNREIGKLENTLDELPENVEPDFQIVPSLEIKKQIFQAWQEAVEREISLPVFHLEEITEKQKFNFPANRRIESLRDENERIVGIIIRTQQEISGEIELRVHEIEKTIEGVKLFKITVQIKNLTAFENAESQSREFALLHSLVSTHTILNAANGEFVSLLEPPDELIEEIEACENIKTYPVLVGDAGEKNCLLSSPIILYDYPQIAQESAGDLFDGGEIDEILTLRIMTLTDEEKREMRGLDDRVRKMLERTENLSEERLLKMHGAMKTVGKASER